MWQFFFLGFPASKIPKEGIIFPGIGLSVFVFVFCFVFACVKEKSKSTLFSNLAILFVLSADFRIIGAYS